MKNKSVKIWLVCIVLPIPLIVVAWFMQAFALFSSFGPEFLRAALSVVALLMGVVGVLLLIGLPVWIVLLLRAKKQNAGVKQS
ncbi:MAG: hypothetical protein LC687_01910 [Actinobacteria bacterium]|nr:hypothetical protein [Actinomycetota bacterium]